MEKEWFDFLVFLIWACVVSLLVVLVFLSVFFHFLGKEVEKNLSSLAKKIGEVFLKSEGLEKVFITKDRLSLFLWKELENGERKKVARLSFSKGNRKKASFLVYWEENNELLPEDLISFFNKNRDCLGEIELVF